MSAAWAGAIAAIASVVLARWPGRWLWHLARRTMDFLDDWNGETGRAGVDPRPGVMERLHNVEIITAEVRAETKPNGGSSLRDVVQRTATDVLDVKSDVAGVLDRMNRIEQQREDREEPPS